jgi:hypothetical protein
LQTAPAAADPCKRRAKPPKKKKKEPKKQNPKKEEKKDTSMSRESAVDTCIHVDALAKN